MLILKIDKSHLGWLLWWARPDSNWGPSARQADALTN